MGPLGATAEADGLAAADALADATGAADAAAGELLAAPFAPHAARNALKPASADPCRKRRRSMDRSNTVRLSSLTELSSSFPARCRSVSCRRCGGSLW